MRDDRTFAAHERVIDPARHALGRQLTFAGLIVVASCGAPESAFETSANPVASASQPIMTGSGTITQAADEGRTSFYPDEPGLDPSIVGGTGFGKLFQTKLPLTMGEQVYTQPLVNQDGTVLVATEANNVYVLDGLTGAVKASRALGTPWNEMDVPCGDLLPTIGVTGTPVIDVASNTAYFFSKSYDAAAMAVVYLHAVDASTLAEKSGFPVTIGGPADNDPTVTFNPHTAHQRVGLLLMNGVVYGAFAAHCDTMPFHGWVIGVTTGGQIVTRFATETGLNSKGGAGIWQTGSGLVTDGPGRIWVVTGNGQSTAPTAPISATAPNTFLDNAVVQLQLQPNGALQPAQWFAPFNTGALNGADLDLSGGGLVSLPSPFGTPTVPNLAVIAGKEGRLYVLDRDHLGGFMGGKGGTDLVLSTTVVDGGMWSKPAVWPGDGGYLYVDSANSKLQALKFGTDATGAPTFTIVGRTTDIWGGNAGNPIVTSNGTNAGSALMWITHTTGQFRAYDAVPINGVLNVRFSADFGPHVKYQSAGVGGGRLYVGTNDGQVTAFGVNKNSPVTGTLVDFGSVMVGTMKTATATLTASQGSTITALSSSDPTSFTVGASTPTLPATLAMGQTMTVEVTFAPKQATGYAASLNVTSSGGPGGIALKGVGQANGPLLSFAPLSIDFGGIAIGTSKTSGVVLTNAGTKPLTVTGITAPMAPFTVMGTPPVNQTIAPAASITVNVVFAPTATGMFSSHLIVQSSGGNATVPIAGSGGGPPVMVISSLSLNYGIVAVGTTSSKDFTITNTGGSDLTITKSKPPSQGVFTAQTQLAEGTKIPAGGSLTETVVAGPTASGNFTDAWILNGDDMSGLQTVTFTAATAPRMVAAGPDAGPVAGSSTDAGAGISASSGRAPANGAFPTPSNSNGCACSSAGTRQGALPEATAGWLAVALLAVRRRRRSFQKYAENVPSTVRGGAATM